MLNSVALSKGNTEREREKTERKERGERGEREGRERERLVGFPYPFIKTISLLYIHSFAK
jgi:hypothetical protein